MATRRRGLVATRPSVSRRASESPIRVGCPSRPSESPIRVAHPSRPSESPIRVACPGQTACRCPYAVCRHAVGRSDGGGGSVRTRLGGAVAHGHDRDGTAGVRGRGCSPQRPSLPCAGARADGARDSAHGARTPGLTRPGCATLGWARLGCGGRVLRRCPPWHSAARPVSTRPPPARHTAGRGALHARTRGRRPGTACSVSTRQHATAGIDMSCAWRSCG
jgi:hypothetical protein